MFSLFDFNLQVLRIRNFVYFLCILNSLEFQSCLLLSVQKCTLIGLGERVAQLLQSKIPAANF